MSLSQHYDVCPFHGTRDSQRQIYTIIFTQANEYHTLNTHSVRTLSPHKLQSGCLVITNCGNKISKFNSRKFKVQCTQHTVLLQMWTVRRYGCFLLIL